MLFVLSYLSTVIPAKAGIQGRCFAFSVWSNSKKLSPYGESLFFACAKKSNQKKRFTAAEWLIKHTPPAPPQPCCGFAGPAGFFDATSCRGEKR
ncbi:MAG: hypothetical protein ABN502_17820, partial [Gammaproteobacteria bacterium]